MTPRHPTQPDPAGLPRPLRRVTVPPSVRVWLEGQVGARVTRVTPLPGASSSAVHGVDLADGGRLVLRRYVWQGFLEGEPAAPGREVDALLFASARGLPAPEVLAADVTGDEVGDGVPVVAMTFLPGRARAVPDPVRVAELAAAIHAVDARGLDHHYFQWYEGQWRRAPEGSRRPELWEQAIELWRNAAPLYRATLVHRDFHPGNVLWVRGRCSGVVDWVNACRGPAGADVAHCRANLTRLAGVAAADQFLAAYQSITGHRHEPYWELASVLEHGPFHWTPEDVIAADRRLQRAIEVMETRP